MVGCIGILVILAVALLASENRQAIAKASVARTLALQVGIAVIAVGTPWGVTILAMPSRGVVGLLDFANVGISFVFGSLANPRATGLILAFQILPVIVFVASLFSVLFHLRIMQAIIFVVGGALRGITGASRLESMSAAACVFVGSAEAPLTILPYLPKISRAQLFVVMAGGLASVSGTVLIAYTALGIRTDLLLTAAFMSAPGGLLMGRILMPETGVPFDLEKGAVSTEDGHQRAGSLVEAATEGALVGMKIMLSVIAVLIALIAMVALANGIVGGIGNLVGIRGLPLEMMLGHLFAPVAWLIGVPWGEATRAGTFLGQKLILNEFLAYASFAPHIREFSQAGQVAITVALCGFANLSGLAILIASLGAVVPERKTEISKLGLKAVLAGTLSNFMSAAIVTVVAAAAAALGIL